MIIGQRRAQFLELLAQSRMESAYFVVARRGKAPPLAPSALLAPLAEAGAREPLPSSLAGSLVQDSGAPAWLSTAVRDFPTLAALVVAIMIDIIGTCQMC
jgi:hypothetical protein